MLRFNHICLIAVFWCLPLLSEEKTYVEIYNIGNEFECLSYKGYNRYENSARFKNECTEKVDAYVCIEYTDGTTELRRSRRTIPKRGNWKFSTEWGKTPKNIQWSSAPFDPDIPKPCS